MNDWYTICCEIAFHWVMALFCVMAIITYIAHIIDKLRERKERRKILSERYVRYRINRWNKEGF